MSNAYNQGYGSQSNTYPPPYPQQLTQNFPQQLTQNFPQPYSGYPQSYGNQNFGFQPMGDEYLRQPASAPSVPVVPPAVEPEPRVIIVHNEPDCCSSFCCECMSVLIAKICYLIVSIVVCALVIGLLVYFLKYYRKHY